MPEDMLTTVEAARSLHVSTATLQRWVREGIVRPTLYLPGGAFRWLMSDLHAQLEARESARNDG